MSQSERSPETNSPAGMRADLPHSRATAHCRASAAHSELNRQFERLKHQFNNLHEQYVALSGAGNGRSDDEGFQDRFESAPSALLDRLEHLADIEPLTGLPNRRVFLDRLRQARIRSRRRHTVSAVLHVGIDHLRRVNDEFGYEAGNELLRQIADRLRSRVRETDSVCRLGGDQFGVLLEELNSLDDARLVGRKILECLSAPMTVGGQLTVVEASIGTRAVPLDNVDPTTLLRKADVGICEAEEDGRSDGPALTPALQVRRREREPFEELRRAIGEDQLFLEYQPQLDVRDHSLRGVEALVRWRHPLRGVLLPASFVPAAEATGLIHELGWRVLEHGARQALQWQAAGFSFGRLAINVSPRQFDAPDLVHRLRCLLDTIGLAPTTLELEVTESAIIRDPERASQQLAELRALGVTVTLDDFGTGYSSMNLLSRLPLNRLKIDASFVAGLPHDAGYCSIVRAMTSLAHDLGMTIAAEGVETDEQAQFLAARGCDVFQGFRFGRPVAASDLFPGAQRVVGFPPSLGLGSVPAHRDFGCGS